MEVGDDHWPDIALYTVFTGGVRCVNSAAAGDIGVGFNR